MEIEVIEALEKAVSRKGHLQDHHLPSRHNDPLHLLQGTDVYPECFEFQRRWQQRQNSDQGREEPGHLPSEAGSGPKDLSLQSLSRP